MNHSPQTSSPESPQPDNAIRSLPRHLLLAALLIAGLIRLQMRTLRITIEDEGGHSDQGPQSIWCFWHNRALLIPALYRKIAPTRPGVVFTSASRDGSLLASVVKSFNFQAVRGSSSRRGTAALRELVKHLRNGLDAGVTPDGPRGPKYNLQAGLISASALSHVSISPAHIDFTDFWRLNSWDSFIIPKPGSAIRLRLDKVIPPPEKDDEAIESARVSLEKQMILGLKPF